MALYAEVPTGESEGEPSVTLDWDRELEMLRFSPAASGDESG